MALQNIGAGNRDDAFYRYKMPKLITKIEGRGNGIKTNLVNMVEVAKALARPPAYTTKFFGNELGAQSKYDEKVGTCIVNGSHETSKLAALLEIFIKKYVQCYNCGNPETTVNVSGKSQLITLKCAACGFVSDVDMRDKLTTFILRNPPETKKMGSKKDKDLRRAEKERLKEGEIADKANKELKEKKKNSDEDLSSQGDEHEEEVEDVEWLTDPSVEAAQKRIQEQLTAATSEMVMIEEDAPRTTSPTKVPKGKLMKKSSSKKVHVAVHPEEPVEEIELPKVEELSLHSKLVNELKELLQKGSSPSQVAAVFEKKQDTPQEIMNAYFEALFGDLFFKGIAEEVSQKIMYLAKMVSNEWSQLRLLGTLETLCKSSPLDVGKEIALVLKVLYDKDVLEEDSIIEWFDNGDSVDPKAVKVRNWAQPFVDWLRDAEADDE
ncbi:unnamed protein product [Calypogeia fissa]